MAENNGTNVGRVAQVTGVVIDAVFPDTLPQIYTAVKIEMSGGNQMDANKMLGSTMQKLHEPY